MDTKKVKREYRIKTVEIMEKFIKKGKKVYWVWKFPSDKHWNARLTPYKEIPYVKIKWNIR